VTAARCPWNTLFLSISFSPWKISGRTMSATHTQHTSMWVQ